MASRSILTLKLQPVQLGKLFGISRMELQVLKWKCPVARMAREWDMMSTELAATERTGRLDVSSEHQSHVHESYSIELKFHIRQNWSLLHQARIHHLQASNGNNADPCLLHE